MSTFYPSNFSNRNGIPLMESANLVVTDTEVTITLSDRSFRWLNQKGIVLFRLNQQIPDGTTATLPIVFSVNNFTQPLTVVGGTAATVAELPGVGVYQLYYDKDANVLQLMTGLVSA